LAGGGRRELERGWDNDFGLRHNMTKWFWVRIQKPVVTYGSGKSSVTSSAGLPSYFKKNILQFYIFYNYLIIVFALKSYIST
jgi:hypothetical protein